MKALLLVAVLIGALVLEHSVVHGARGGGGRGGFGRGIGGRGSSGGGGGFWGKLFGGGAKTNTRAKSISTGATASGNYPKQQHSFNNGPSKGLGTSGFGHKAIESRPPPNPSLYRPKQPPSYNSLPHQSYAHRPPPPPYSKLPPAANHHYPGYSYPSSAGYGRQTNFQRTGYYGGSGGASMYSHQPYYGRSSGNSILMSAALFYGLGRMSGHGHYHSYHNHYYHRHRSTTNATDTNSSTPAPGLFSTEPPVPVPTFDLTKHKLFEPEPVPWNEVNKEPINMKPLWLNESIIDMPFYGYDYATWNETEVIPRPPEPTPEPPTIVKSLADALFAIGLYYNEKTTTTQAPEIIYEIPESFYDRPASEEITALRVPEFSFDSTKRTDDLREWKTHTTASKEDEEFSKMQNRHFFDIFDELKMDEVLATSRFSRR